MSLRPTNGHVFVVPDRRTMTAPTSLDGIAFYLPETTTQYSSTGRVLAAAETWRDHKGRIRETGLLPGHRVVFDYRNLSLECVREIELDGQRALVLPFLFIQAILSEPLPTLADLYRENVDVRQLADDLHQQRLLAPPTCDQCIALAARKLGIAYEQPIAELGVDVNA